MFLAPGLRLRDAEGRSPKRRDSASALLSVLRAVMRKKPCGRDSLTASEARIAEMAAAGWTNSQIAQAIFVTPETVEKHLTRVFAKLGISSRRELGLLGSDALPAGVDRPRLGFR